MGIKDRLKKGLKKFLPVAASIIGGVAAGPAASIIASYAVSKLSEIGIFVNEDDLETFSREALMGVSVEVLKRELTSVLKKNKTLKKEDIESAVDYVVRPLFARISEALDLLRRDENLLREQLLEINASVENISAKMDKISSIQEQILRELRERNSMLNTLFNQFFSKLGFKKGENLVAASMIWSQNNVIASAYEYLGVFDNDLYVDRGTWRTFREFIKSDYPIYLVLAHAGMGKTWELASMSYKLQKLGYPAFFITLRSDFTKALEKIFNTQNIYEIENTVNKYYENAKKKGERENIFLILDGLDEVYNEQARSDILGIIDILTRGTKGIKIVLSCRIFDWTESRGISINRPTIERKMFGEKIETLGVKTSTIINTFKEEELNEAINRYDLENFPRELRAIATNPFAFRMIAEHYTATMQYPEINEKFMEKVFNRMGFNIFTIPHFNILIDEILKRGTITLGEVIRNIRIDERAYSNIFSSGLITIEKKGLTVHLKINEKWKPYIEKIRKKEKQETEAPKHVEKIVIEIGGKEYEIGEEATIGRNKITQEIEIRTKNKIINTGIKMAYVSKEHLKIEKRNNQIYIQDLESKNGTYLNGEKIPPREYIKVNDGQEINLAGFVNIKIRFKTQQ